MKCLFIYEDGSEEVQDVPIASFHFAGQEMPPKVYYIADLPPVTTCFSADEELEPKTVCHKTFMIQQGSGHELLPVYEEVP